MSMATEADVLKTIASMYGCDESVFNIEKKPENLNILNLFKDYLTREQPPPSTSQKSRDIIKTIALCETAKHLVEANICTAEALTQGPYRSLDGPVQAQCITLRTVVAKPAKGESAPQFKVLESACSDEDLSTGNTTEGESDT